MRRNLFLFLGLLAVYYYYVPLRVFIAFYAFLSLCGLYLYRSIVPRALCNRYSGVILPAFLGSASIAILGSGYIALSWRLYSLFLLLCVFSTSVLIAELFLNRKRFSWKRSAEWLHRTNTLLIILLPLLIVTLLPLLHANVLTSPFRIGPDLASYAKMAQYLIDGFNLNDAFARKAEFASMSAGEINRFADATMSWPFLYWYRWGLSSFQVMFYYFAHAKHIFEVEFLSLAFSQFFNSAIIFLILTQIFEVGVPISIATGYLSAFNANLLNLWFEGFYGNMFALSFWSAILLMFLFLLRESSQASKETYKIFVTLILFWLALFLSYSEMAMFLIPAVGVFIFLFDRIFFRTIHLKKMGLLISSFIVSFLLAIPFGFIFELTRLAFKQVVENGGNGFTQPRWANLPEILGVFNIYSKISPELSGVELPSGIYMFAASMFFTILILVIWIIRFRKDRRAFPSVLLGALFFVSLIRYKAIKAGQINYLYMKAYIFALPILICYLGAALNSFLKIQKTDAIAKALYVGSFIILLAIPISGAKYIFRYVQQQRLVDPALFPFHDFYISHKNENFIMISKNCDYGTEPMPHGIVLTPEFMLATVVPFYWIVPNLWEGQTYYERVFDKKILNLVRLKEAFQGAFKDQRIVYRSAQYALIDTGQYVRDVFDKKLGKIDFGLLCQ